MIQYDRFYKRHGVRRDSDLRSPELSDIRDLEIPRGSIIHYLPVSQTDYGMGSDDTLLRDVDRMVMVDHVVSLVDPKGNPKALAVDDDSLIRRYQRQNRKMKRLRNLSQQLRDDRTVLVANYGLLPHLYRYTSSVYAGYYRRFNLLKTLVHHIKALHGELPERQHFISMALPDTLPSVSDFIATERRIDQQTLENFDSQEALWLLDLWTFLGENRSESILSVLSSEQLNQTNLIFHEADKWWLVNLGKVESFRQGEDDSEGSIQPRALQRILLRAVMDVYEAGTVVGDEESTDDTSAPSQQDPNKTQNTETPQGTQDQTPTTPDSDDPDQLDDELNALNDVQTQRRQRQRQRDQAPRSVSTDQVDYAQAVLTEAEQLGSKGLLSAAEYKRLEKLSRKYKQLPNPYTGKGSLEEAAKVTSADLQLPEGEPFPNSPMVTDDSMRHSSLQHFDPAYINNVLPKDVMSMVLGVQQGGFAIDAYEVENYQDVADDYDIHTVRVVPVNGSPSTLKFRLPRVKPDGTYKAGGVVYRIRKLRGD